MRVHGEVYLHVSNSGATIQVADEGHGPTLVIKTGAFGNLNQTTEIATTKRSLRHVSVMLAEACERDFSEPSAHPAEVAGPGSLRRSSDVQSSPSSSVEAGRSSSSSSASGSSRRHRTTQGYEPPVRPLDKRAARAAESMQLTVPVVFEEGRPVAAPWLDATNFAEQVSNNRKLCVPRTLGAAITELGAVDNSALPRKLADLIVVLAAGKFISTGIAKDWIAYALHLAHRQKVTTDNEHAAASIAHVYGLIAEHVELFFPELPHETIVHSPPPNDPRGPLIGALVETKPASITPAGIDHLLRRTITNDRQGQKLVDDEDGVHLELRPDTPQARLAAFHKAHEEYELIAATRGSGRPPRRGSLSYRRARWAAAFGVTKREGSAPTLGATELARLVLKAQAVLGDDEYEYDGRSLIGPAGRGLFLGLRDIDTLVDYGVLDLTLDGAVVFSDQPIAPSPTVSENAGGGETESSPE